MQVVLTLHAPDRHTVAALPLLHDPWLLVYPHLLSVSQTPEAQTDAPTLIVHIPLSVGVWPEMVGMAVPLASCAVQTLVCVLQNWVLEH
jgi:hypothetical protein